MPTDSLYPHISLYGAPGVGKTTGRDFLDSIGFKIVSFAGYHVGGLRDVVLRVFGPDAVNNRPILNGVGMKMRDVDPDAWVRPAMREVERSTRPVVMDDMRGDNEWWQSKAHGFVHVHLVADAQLREERLRLTGKLEGSDLPFLWILEDTERYHPDYVVHNDGSEDELYEALTDVLNIERSKRA